MSFNVAIPLAEVGVIDIDALSHVVAMSVKVGKHDKHDQGNDCPYT